MIVVSRTQSPSSSHSTLLRCPQNHKTAEAEANKAERDALKKRRQAEALLAESENDQTLAKTKRKQAAQWKKMAARGATKIASLKAVHEDGKEMDLPMEKTFAAVKAALKIETPQDVNCINTTALGRDVIQSFRTRGLMYCQGHDDELPIDRNWKNYSDATDYQQSIALHLQIDMSEDPNKRKARALMEEPPSAKKAKTGED